MGRRIAVVVCFGTLAGFGQACGTDVTSATAAGGSTTGTTDTSGLSNSDSGTELANTGADSACAASDLPPPFCHEFRPYRPPPQGGEVIGYLDAPLEAVRPWVVFNAADSTLTLVSPLDTERVLVGPREVDWDDALRVGTSADFDADGVQDFAAWHPDTGTLAREFVIISGDSMEVLGRVATEDPHTNYLGSVDVDGDGRSEILTQSPAENTSEISAWGFSGGGIDRIASGTIEPPCYPESAVEGDFDGDGLRDLALTWNVGCDVHIGDDPEILIFFAAANSGTSLSPTRAPQPGWAAGVSSVDVDSDGTTELILGVSARNIQVLSWTGESFVAREQLRIPDEYGSSLAEFAAGRLGQEGAPGIFVGTLLASGAPLEEAFIGALFLPPASPQFVPQQGTLVFDLNDDGIDDFSAFRDGVWGQYVSLGGR